jgi:hypothetical protein
LNKRPAILILFLLLLSAFASGQQAVVFGVLTDTESTPIPFANMAVKGTPAGTTTGKDGSFELKIAANQPQTILISYVGYDSDSIVVNLKPNERKEVNIKLRQSQVMLNTIEVKDQQLRTNTFSRLDPKSVEFIPTMNASVEDLIKTLPGVSSRNEMSSQYSVRGGNFDENLVYINDVEIYRPFLVRSGQQEGMSIINPDLVSGISFSAGGFDAKYGDKMSSVLDIRYKKPVNFAGSFDVSLLGADAHIEGSLSKKFTYLLGARYKTNTYFLKGLDTKGNYKPRYFDVQGMLNYEINKKWELSFLGIYSNNSYKLTPETRETSFGAYGDAYKIKIFFDGHEVDSYQTWLGSLTATFKPTSDIRLRLIASTFTTYERETFDISGEYWIGKLETNQGSSEFGQVTEVLGVGGYLAHARNYLDGTVYSLEHRGNWDKSKSQMQWGIKYQYETFDSRLSEYETRDSAGYTLPKPPDSLGSSNPPHDSLLMYRSYAADETQGNSIISAFIQDTWTFDNKKNSISITGGLRTIYCTYNGQFLLNPRVNFSFKPLWKTETIFRLSGGWYSQPPSFREMTDLYGRIVPDLKAQTAIQGVGGVDLYFKGWGRPFKFVTEIFYKYIQNLIPYEVDNMKIRYYGTNDAYGYAAGIDFRINGEFVKGAESWASISFLKTEEYFEGQWIPRPTDQRMNLSIFFQDYIPKFPTWKVNLTFVYGTGLPIGPPNSPRSAQTLRLPPYRRVDIGLSKQLIGERTKFKSKNPFRAFNTMWISLEVFNLLDLSNTESYLWITGVNGAEYAVPNYLTPRQFNIKLIASF